MVSAVGIPRGKYGKSFGLISLSYLSLYFLGLPIAVIGTYALYKKYYFKEE